MFIKWISTVMTSFYIIYPRSCVLMSCLAGWRESLILGIKNIVCNPELLRWAVSHRNSSGLFLALCVKFSTREKQICSEFTNGNRNYALDTLYGPIHHSEVKMTYGGRSITSQKGILLIDM